jgi:spore germination protein KB
MKLERITQNQILMFFVLYYFSTQLGFAFGPLVSLSQYDTWLSLCFGGLGGVFLAYFTLKLANRNANEFFVHFGRKILPVWIHIPMMGILFFFFLHLGSIIIREYEDFMVQNYLPSTPSAAVGIMFAMVIAITVRTGIETLFRTAQGLFFLIITAVILQYFLVMNEFEWNRWMAFVTNHQIKGMLKGSYTITPWFGEIILLIFFFPFIAEKEKTLKSIMWATIFSTIILICTTVSLLFLFGPNLASHLTYPVLEIIRFVRIADFIENLDPLLVAIWSTTVFLKVGILLYVSTLILSQLFNLKDYRPLVFSLTLVMITMSLQMSENTAELNDFFKNSWTTFAYFVEIIPLLYFFIDKIKNYFQKKISHKNPN